MLNKEKLYSVNIARDLNYDYYYKFIFYCSNNYYKLSISTDDEKNLTDIKEFTNFNIKEIENTLINFIQENNNYIFLNKTIINKEE